MYREKREYFKLSNNNEHLLDVFSDNYYLELGTIEYNPLDDLLSGKLVDYKDLTYFDILKKGIGSMQSSSEELLKKLPFVYFNNLAAKNKSYRLAITYGMLLRRNGYKEFFTPIILIPVNMYFEKDTILFQMINKPFINPYLKKEDDMNIEELVFNEKLDSILNMDRYIMSLIKNHTNNIRVENYLTVINTISPNIKLNQKNFYIKNNMGPKLIDKYSVDCENDIYNITDLDRIQRNAVGTASCGNSFAIVGHQGTGKTTTLINIASDFIKQGKRVLYISNNNSTLNYVYDTFKDCGLRSYVSDFTKSFNKVNEKNAETKKEQILDSFEKNIIKEKYNEVDEITKHFGLYKKNYSVIELMNELMVVPKPKEEFSEKILNSIFPLYKYEFNRVINATQKIEQLMEKMESFVNSRFINVPISHQMKDSTEALNLIEQIYNSFCILNEEKKILESNYGFANVENYAYLSTAIKSYDNLKKSLVPLSWYKEQNDEEKLCDRFFNFKRATQIFDQLKEETEISKKYYNIINSKFNVQKIEFDVKKAIDEITDGHFELGDDKINIVLGDYARIEKELSKAVAYCKDLDNEYKTVSEILKFDFGLNEAKVVEELLECIFVLDKGHFSKYWCDYEKRDETYKRVVYIENIIDKYEDAINIYNKYFDGVINNVDQHIKTLIKKNKDDKRKYRGVYINELLPHLHFIKENHPVIHKLKKEYILLAGSSYEYKTPVSVILKEFIEKHLNISNKQIRLNLEKVFPTLSYEQIKLLINKAKLLKIAINRVDASYSLVKSYNIMQTVEGTLNKAEQLRSVVKYIKNVFKWQTKMNRLLKDKKDVILIDSYLELEKLQDSLSNINEKINSNEEYKFIFEKLFDGENTDITQLEQIINEFTLYLSLFADADCLVNSFNENFKAELSIHLNSSEAMIIEISKYFQNYIKIFKTNISKYYYDDFSKIIAYFKDLLESKEELDTYLQIADQMKVILSYKLYSLNNYIIYHNHELFTDRLKYSYYNNLYEEYVKEHPSFKDTKSHNELLDFVILKEKDLISSNSEVIKLENKVYRTGKASHLDYDEYIRKNKNSKLLFLCDTKTANIFLDINLFDIAIIDDAHLLDANEYYKVVNAKQVVISGEPQVSNLPKKSLISRIKPNNIINLNYRYARTPLNLLNQINNLNGRFHKFVNLNKGISVSKENFNQIIIEKLLNEEKCKINFFTTSLIKTRDLINNVGNSLFDRDLSVKSIMYFLENNLNICDVNLGNCIQANYNILDLESYYQVEDEALIEKYLNSLLCCGTELIIIDNKNHLESSRCSKFVLKLKQILEYEITEPTLVEKTVISRISKSLANKEIKTVGIFNPLHLVVEYKNKYFGILLLENPNNTDFTILNEYREYRSNDFNIIVKWLTDLIDNYDKVITSMVEVIKK